MLSEYFPIPDLMLVRPQDLVVVAVLSAAAGAALLFLAAKVRRRFFG